MNGEFQNITLSEGSPKHKLPYGSAGEIGEGATSEIAQQLRYSEWGVRIPNSREDGQ